MTLIVWRATNSHLVMWFLVGGAMLKNML